MKSPLLFLLLLLSFNATLAQNFFEEITTEAGILDPGNKNHGIAFADFDNDGDEDIYAFTRLNENKLYENLGDGTFNNVATIAGVDHSGSTRAAVWGDVNNDGWIDLYIGSYQEADRLYLNNGPINNGDVTFTDITFDAGIFNEEETISVHMADIDNDGFLDIYVANFLADNKLYKNNGNLTFSDYTNTAGVNDDSYSMACAFFDYDNDGDQDLYLAHDFEIPNILFQNDGAGNFTNVANSAGVDYAGHGMGVDVADINRDGALDFYITDLDENVLFLNNGDGTFSNISNTAGIEDLGMGWSTMFLDFDNDGWQDIYVVNDSQFSPEPNVLYRNNGDNTFSIVAATEAISSAGAGTGGAVADINNDGFVDIAIANTLGSSGNQLFQNMGNTNNWIGFKLIGTKSNTSAVGSKIEIEYGNGLYQQDVISAGTGFAGANTLNVHFGLADHDVISLLRVSWPSGQVETFNNLSAGEIYTIEEEQNPIINALTVNDSTVEKYGKFECTLDIDAVYDNPYDYDQVQISAVFTAPSGVERSVDGFYMQDFDLNTTNGSITEVGEGGFKIRFSPDEIGDWTFQATLTDSTGTTTYDPQSFECVEISSENNKGFVRTGLTNYLEYDNGDQYILVGENMAWENTNPYTNYKSWLTKLNDNGGNFIRLWHAHWGLGIEWENGWDDFEGLRRYKESNCFYQDWLYDYCADRGIHIMLALQHHGPVSSNVNPNWNESPYNVANGGPCQNTWDFFTNEEAKNHTKNRYRYIVARWGYSRSIMSWELFNEVNWTDNFESYLTEIQDWHAEMAGYLKTIDPYSHLVTTSYAHSDQDPVVWSNPDMDFTQTHYYINTGNLEKALVGGIRSYLEDFDKPTLNGEFGLGGNPNLSNADADGIHLHNSMWGSLFGGGMGTAMTWWWDVYVHPRDLYYHFAPIRTILDDISFVEKDMRPTLSYTTGASGDLLLTPSLGWGALGDPSITINQNGTTTPEAPALSQYLYGSLWNTEFRSPPTFIVDYPAEGEFTVRTGGSAGQSPKVTIYLNGEMVLDDLAFPNQDHTIIIPAGPNEIMVDNLGTDWVSITSYNFSGVGSKIDSYTLLADDKDEAAGWVLNNEYNHINIDENGVPESVTGGELIIDDFVDGTYFIKWYDCLTGEIVNTEELVTTDNQIIASIPELYWDLAFKIDEEEVMVNTNAIAAADPLVFNVYPNPVRAGNEINMQLSNQFPESGRFSLLDASGKLVYQQRTATTVVLPKTLPSGIYWVKVDVGGKVGTRPIFVETY